MDAITELARVADNLRLEQQEDLRQHQLLLEKRSIRERIQAGLAWYPLKVAETGIGLGAYPYIIVEYPGEWHRHYFQAASPVSLFSQAEGNEGEKISGTVGYVDERKMKISFFADELPDWVDEGRIGVNLLFDSRSYDEMWRALNFFINVEKGRARELRDILLGCRAPSFAKSAALHSPVLNDSQNEALQTIAEAEDVALVHGPPGTGKTTTLVEAIRVLVARGEQVLVCAPSNAAVDHLTRSIAAAGLRPLRIGNLARIGDDTAAWSLDAVVEQERDFKQIRELKKRASEMRRMAGKYRRQFGKEEAEQRRLLFGEARSLSREARELESYLVNKVVGEAQAVTCTLIGATHEYLRDRTFATVIIDEAGQAPEPACWVPVMKAGRVIMAGDPFQLPPTVKSEKAARQGFAVTLLEKAISRHERVSLLKTQYRMNEQIMRFPCDWFYKGLLEAHESVRHWFLPGAPDVLEFVDTAGCGYEEEESQESESKRNPEEAALVRRHFDRFASGVSVPFDAGVIAPYRAQIDLLSGQFSDLPHVAVNTIDSFQGQERDVIYISLVRSNNRSEIGFLKDYRRLNVAMTRARKKLVVVGDSATLAGDPFFGAFVDFAEKSGAWRSAWEWMP
jgi:ATP-dependent RNA/DNA helicase IGHMBP2